MVVPRRVKYCIAHVLLYIKSIPKALSRVPLHIKLLPHYIDNMNKNLTLRYMGYLSNVILMVALCIGLYTRWLTSQDMIILMMAVFGLFVFCISCALVYYFSMEIIGFSLSRLWIGCLLGVLAFTQISVESEDGNTIEEVMNILLVISTLLRAFWNILERVMHFSDQNFVLVNYYECLEMIGLCISSMVTGNDVLCLSLLILSVGFIVINIRLKSLLGIFQLLLVIVISSTLYFPHLLKIKVNPFAMSCFLVRMGFESILDIYYCPLSTLERWQRIFHRAAAIRRLLILLGIVLEMSFIVINAVQIPQHKEWYIVVPIFAAFGTVWLCYHVVFTVTCWQLSNKISDCNATYRGLAEGGRNMRRIMAAKGVRHFSLISQRLVCVTLLTTVIMGAIGWRTKSGLSLSLLFSVIPLESAVLSMLWHMGSSLGGTIIGYALVAPALPMKVGQSTTVLPTNAMQEISSRATHILNTVQRFFSYHLMENYGCDYSSSGLTEESVQAKLRAFFQRHTSDGPKYDTYMVYYSGHVHENGDWALAGGGTLKLETLLEWWIEYNDTSTSRLILVLDTDHSAQWVRPVRRLRGVYIAIQTCRTLPIDDPEEGNRIRIGNFTADWMDYNSANTSDVNWKESAKFIKSIYGVSRNWTDFIFHLPTEDDISQHWDVNFPKVTKPLIMATNFPQCGNSLCCCDCFIRCIQRKRMAWFPPVEYETGHGFKLVRS